MESYTGATIASDSNLAHCRVPSDPPNDDGLSLEVLSAAKMSSRVSRMDTPRDGVLHRQPAGAGIEETRQVSRVVTGTHASGRVSSAAGRRGNRGDATGDLERYNNILSGSSDMHI